MYLSASVVFRTVSALFFFARVHGEFRLIGGNCSRFSNAQLWEAALIFSSSSAFRGLRIDFLYSSWDLILWVCSAAFRGDPSPARALATLGETLCAPLEKLIVWLRLLEGSGMCDPPTGFERFSPSSAEAGMTLSARAFLLLTF